MGKHNKMRILICIAIGCLMLIACGLTDLIISDVEDRAQDVEKMVALTLTALANPDGAATPTQAQPTEAPAAAPTPTDKVEPQAGVISGDLYYPSEGIPPLRIVAFEVENWNSFYSKEVHAGRTYQLEVPPGTYYVLAYVLDPGVMDPDFSGAYSQFVLCGLQAGCEDHSLVPVKVLPGETVNGIDLADWYLPVDQSDLWPSNPFAEATGGIRGSLGYPSEYIPPMRVVAFDVNSQDYTYVDTLRNQDSYEITGLPAGTYRVVAYVREQGPDLAGGYSHFVTCGMSQGCDDHRLIDVNVYAGEMAEGVDPVDFYIRPGEAGWPENPTE